MERDKDICGILAFRPVSSAGVDKRIAEPVHNNEAEIKE